jgi:hypothetical protein
MLKRLLEGLSPVWAAAIVIGTLVVCLLLPPPGHQGVYATNQFTAESLGTHDLWGTWSAIAALAATGFTGIIALFAFIQIRDNRRSSERQLRAYVMVGTATIFDIVPNKIPNCKIQIKNFGQTPAYRLRCGISMGFTRFPIIDSDIVWPTVEYDEKVRAERPIAPGDDFPVFHDLGKTISIAQVEALLEGRWAIWIAGRVIYTDAFDVVRRTNFCFYTTKETGVGNLAAVLGKNNGT